MFNNIEYNNYHHLAIGKIGEYWTKLALTLHGLDTYTTEVDNKGIDFIVRNSRGVYFDIQVKTVRRAKTSYVFMPKENEWKNLRDNLYLALVLIVEKEMPKLFLIPSTAWQNESNVLKSRDYGEDKKSMPEWGINISLKNMEEMNAFSIEKQIHKMI
jgi:uncharacterized membrane protein